MMAGMLMTVSCRNDDKEEEVTSVIGNWKVQKMTAKGTFTSGGFPIPVPNTSSESACVRDSKLDLNADKTGFVLLKQDITGPCEEIGNDNFTYTYDPDTKTITAKYNGSTEEFTVSHLTNNEMTLKQVTAISTPQGIFNGEITLNMKK